MAFFREKKLAWNAERNKEKSETVRERERKCERGIEKARKRGSEISQLQSHNYVRCNEEMKFQRKIEIKVQFFFRGKNEKLETSGFPPQGHHQIFAPNFSTIEDFFLCEVNKLLLLMHLASASSASSGPGDLSGSWELWLPRRHRHFQPGFLQSSWI